MNPLFILPLVAAANAFDLGQIASIQQSMQNWDLPTDAYFNTVTPTSGDYYTGNGFGYTVYYNSEFLAFASTKMESGMYPTLTSMLDLTDPNAAEATGSKAVSTISGGSSGSAASGAMIGLSGGVLAIAALCIM